MHSAQNISIQTTQIMDNINNVFNIDTATNIGYQRWRLLVVNVYVACAQSNFYHFRTVVTRATFGLLAVAAFVMSSNMPTAD